MANNQSKEFRLKFEDFRELHAPNLIMNIWCYNVINHPCPACKTYIGYCGTALKEKWRSEWGNFDNVVKKIKMCDRTFIDGGSFWSANRHEFLLLLLLKKKNDCFVILE